MTFGQFLSILKARWWLALLVLASTVLATLAVSLSLPKQYKATASVLAVMMVEISAAPVPNSSDSSGRIACGEYRLMKVQ